MINPNPTTPTPQPTTTTITRGVIMRNDENKMNDENATGLETCAQT